MNQVLVGYAKLARPANLPTAAADILAGVAIAGAYVSFEDMAFLSSAIFVDILFLIFSSVFLYAGGVVLNDVFDIEIDKVERPERPIPSGVVSVKSASMYGGFLMILGILLAFVANNKCGFIAIALAVSILAYDSFSKKHGILGPLNMGLCRALNLILGMAILGDIQFVWYALIPMVYIFAITLISRGEVHGNNKNHIIWAGILYSIVIFMVASIQLMDTDNMMQAIPFIILFGFLVFRPLLKAYKHNAPKNIKNAVKAGVLSLIVLDAALAVGYSNWQYGLLILALLPVSFVLSKIFAVT
ncbi:MAG: UbiA-like protein EboC [Maribacter sp.]|nr:UbiA-like protein EboC [Maribacter sp.]